MQTSTLRNRSNHRVVPLHVAASGRVRIGIPELYRNQELGKRIEIELLQYDGINQVFANPLTGNVLVVYKNKKQHRDNIYQILETILDLGPHSAKQKRKGMPNGKMQWHCISIEDIAKQVGTSTERGLPLSKVEVQQRKFGANSISRQKGRSKFSIFSHQFENLPARLLGGSAILSAMTGGIVDASVIAVVLLINGYIGYSMECSSEKIIHSITQPDHVRIRVMRNGKIIEIDPINLVVGDLFVLGPGITVPADGRLIKAEGLTIDESILTGESLPVSKTVTLLSDPNLPLGDRTNMVFRGTVVTGGGALAVAVAVGNDSEIGKIQRLIDTATQPPTPLEKQLDHLGNQMSMTALSASGFMLVLGIMRGYPFLKVLQSALSMTVAAIPESLPTVATTTLARGLRTLKQQDIVVRHLGAMETLATTDHICLDKTGTLTMNQMEVTSVITPSGAYMISGSDFTRDGRPIQVHKHPTLEKLITIAALCNEAQVSNSKKRHSISHSINGSSTESALLKAAMRVGIDPLQLKTEYPLLTTRYRTEKRPYMMTIHNSMKEPTEHKLVAVKGSPNEVLGLCVQYRKGNKSYDLSDDLREEISQENQKQASQGLRVLGLAYGPDEKHLIWLGLVCMTDPIRLGMRELIPLFHQAGIESSMITGDQPLTAEAIGKALGIDNIYARISPSKKLEIVRELQSSKKKIVAMVGDGINDGPALKSADVGIAMAARGSDTASQAADIVLPNDNIHGLILAIQEGRAIHQDIKKAVDYAVPKNLSEILYTLISMLFWQGEPLSPTQFLWINLITDTYPELALAQESPTGNLLKQGPQNFKKSIVSKSDIGRVSFDSIILSIAPLMSYSIGIMSHGSPQRARSAAFMTMTGSSLLYTLNARSSELSLFNYQQLPKNKHITLAIGTGLITQTIGLIVSPLRRILDLQTMTQFDIALSTFNSVLPLLAIEFGKFMRKPVTSN